MYLDSSIANLGMSERELYLTFDDNSCDRVSFLEGDFSTPTLSGDCSVTHGGYIDFEMGDGRQYNFQFVFDFTDILDGMSDPTQGESNQIIGRYYENVPSSGETRLLYMVCDDSSSGGGGNVQQPDWNTLLIEADMDRCMDLKWSFYHESMGRF